MTLAKSSEPLVKAYSNSTLKLSLTKNSSTAAPTLSSVMSTVPTLKETISTCSISRPYRPKTTRNTQQSTYRILPSRLLRLTTTSSLKQSITKNSSIIRVSSLYHQSHQKDKPLCATSSFFCAGQKQDFGRNSANRVMLHYASEVGSGNEMSQVRRMEHGVPAQVYPLRRAA